MTEYRVLVEIISDDIPETDECLSIVLVGSNIQGPGQADIIIVDDDGKCIINSNFYSCISYMLY